MIGGKTAAIVRYAAWAGAVLGGATEAEAARWDEFGLALGLGFQIHDDLLGIWGATAETGKAPADDIRRRKKSLPVLLLRERLPAGERAQLDALYAAESIDPAGIDAVLRLLAREGIQSEVSREVALYHDQAALALVATSASNKANPYRRQLDALIARLATRTG
jgi:geranylgeranyl diphosphate synthase type I